MLVSIPFVSCNSNAGKAANDKEDTTNNVVAKEQQAVAPGTDADTLPVNGADSASNSPLDDMMAQLQKTPGNDSGANRLQSIFNKIQGGGKDSNLSRVLSKLQGAMNDSGNNPGDAISNAILNFQMSQMKDDNPLKQVTQGMMAAEKNGTALPAKAYTAAYKPEQPADYAVPVDGSGTVYELQYTGGTVANGKKDGLWKNICINTKNNTGWNIFSESYATSSAVNMKIHATTLSNKDSAYIISFNAQYQKYTREKIADKGKYESNVQVQKIGTEKMFGFNCMHIRVSYTVSALHQTTHITDDEWYSSEVPGAQFLSPRISESHAPEAIQKIIATGCNGALVKFKSGATLIQLTGISKKDMSDSLFVLPANYQPDKNTDLYGVQ